MQSLKVASSSLGAAIIMGIKYLPLWISVAGVGDHIALLILKAATFECRARLAKIDLLQPRIIRSSDFFNASPRFGAANNLDNKIN